MCCIKKRGVIFLGILWGFGAIPGLSYELPDTGQTNCYSDVGSVITPCPNPGERFYGQDGNYKGAQPAFLDNGDGTVTDLNTGLMWKDSIPSVLTWQDACDYCESLVLPSGGYSDWRLPTLRELISIINYSRYSPAFFTDYFKGIDGKHMWSSDTITGYPLTIWVLNIQTGGTWDLTKGSTAVFLCVRGSSTPDTVFHDNGDGTVSDSVTGLIWQKADSQNDRSYMWEEALDYCESLKLGGRSDWRLPNVKELQSIVDLSRSGPAIDPVFDCGWDPFYFTSTTCVPLNHLDHAWYVRFGMGGYIGYNAKDRQYKVRCVCGGYTSTRYVSTDGYCGGRAPCHKTIQEAIEAAGNKTEILIAEGTYTEAITLNSAKSVTLQGGWNTSFGNQSGTTTLRSAPRAPQGSLTLQELTIKPE